MRILFIEAQTMFGRAVAAVLEREGDLSITGIRAGRDARGKDDGNVDVILIDLNYDVEDVDASVRYFNENCPSARLCFLSTYIEPELVQRCIAAGAQGYVVKDASFDELAEAIRTIAQGGRFVDPRVEHLLAFPASAEQPLLCSSQLSPRETDIIRLIAQGLSNRDIGTELILSEKTVRTHVSRIFSKLRITTRSQAAVHAIRNGLV